MKRVLCIFLALACLIGVLSGCDAESIIDGGIATPPPSTSNTETPSPTPNNNSTPSGGSSPGSTSPGGTTHAPSPGGGDREEDGSWESVDFDGQEVVISVSVNKSDECMFPAGDIYTKGPDVVGSNEVAKEVRARNTAAAEALNIKVTYQTTDLHRDEVLEHIQNIVMTTAKESPDVYNNDMYGLVRAMVNGYLWNVKNAGKNVVNYLDFTKDGWYEEYIKGCTFDQEKLYIFAGDYFIDMIRMAHVVYVNHDILEANLSKLPSIDSVDDFYADVEAGAWDLDTISSMAGAVFSDTNMDGIAQADDAIVGLVINDVTAQITSAASQISLFYQDKEDGYKPKMIQDIDDFQKLANKYNEVVNSCGVYLAPAGSTNSVFEGSTCFLNGNVLFVYSYLGELESEMFRGSCASKGLVPIPKWNLTVQEEYHTPIHDRAELGCILNTANAFSAASALMQFLNEESDKVIYAYYEKALKFKYNDNKNTRVMMDIVRETTDSPFSWQVGPTCLDLYKGTTPLTTLSLQNHNTISSTFASEKDVYSVCLSQMMYYFKQLP